MDPSIVFLVFLLSVGGAIFIFLIIFGMLSPSEPAVKDPPPTRVGAQATVINASESCFYLAPTGREVFLPPPPHDAAVFEITFSGVLQRKDGTRFADAFYRTDDKGNFHLGAPWLRANGSALSRFEIVASDRCEHRYTIRIDGRSNHDRLTLALDHPSFDYEDARWTGSLCAHVRVLPEGTPGIAEQRRRKDERLEADRNAAVFAHKFSAVIQEFCLRAELYRNWEDQAFREQFARAYGTDLMKCQSDIRKEANHVLEQHHVVAYLRRHNPKVVERLLGKFEALLIAERIALEPKEKPKPLPPPRPRLTIDEVRERICRRIEVQGGDRRAAVATILTQKQEQIEMLDQFSLTEDEREQQVREIEDWAAGQLMKLNEGKEASNAGYQTIS